MPSSAANKCSGCGHIFNQEKLPIFWEINPCKHLACPHCFTAFAASKCISCPCQECLDVPTSFNLQQYEATIISRRSGSHSHYMLQKGSDSCLSTPSLMFHSKEKSYEINLLESPELLPTLFSDLKDHINPMPTNQYQKESEDPLGSLPGGTLDDKLDYLVEEDSNSLLFKCLFALATGDIHKKVEMKDLTKIYVASELLRRFINSRFSKLRHLNGRALSILQVEGRYKFFQRQGICYSRKTESKVEEANTERIEMNMQQLKLNKFCYAILLFDNLGFKNRQGSRSGLGYEQFTVLKVVVINATELQKVGVYSYEGKAALSRATKDWEDLRTETEKVSFRKIIEPNEDDNANLAQNSFHIYHSILTAESNNSFPPHSRCKKILALDELESSKPQVVNLPCYAGRDENDFLDDEEEDDEDEPVNEDSTEAGVHRFDAGIIYDVPMSKDLNKKETCIDLMHYVNDITMAINEGTFDERFRGETPCAENIRLALGGDGHPISAMQRHMKETRNDDEDGRPFWRTLLAVFGGFHLMLEMYKKIGSLFEATHLRFINLLFRKSTGAVNYVLNPGDPGQAEGEMYQRHCAYILSAIRCIVWLKSHQLWEGIDFSDLESEEDELEKYEFDSTGHTPIESEDVEVSIEDLHKFILYRASKKPNVFIMLMEMRFAEVLFLIQRSEYKANASFYCSAMKYALVLCICTNAYHYVEMIMNFFVDRECMSTAERVIMDCFILFRKTKFGKYIFSDRSVEWTMRDIRQYLGKYFKSNTTKLLTQHLLNMEDTKEMKNYAKSAATIGRKSTVKIDKCFLEPYMFCFSANVWLGEPMKLSSKPYKDRLDEHGEEKREPLFDDDSSDDDVDVDDDIISPSTTTRKHFLSPDGEICYSDVLSTYSTYLTRAEQYYMEHFLEGELTAVQRKATTLKKVDISDKMCQLEIEMGLCLDSQKIQRDRKLYTTQRVHEEIMLLIPELEDKDLDIPELPKRKNPSKKDLVQILVKCRQLLKEDDPMNWEDLTRKKIQERYEAHFENPTDVIKKEIQYGFYSYDIPTLQQSPLYLQKYNLKVQNKQSDIHEPVLNITQDEFEESMRGLEDLNSNGLYNFN